MGELFLVNKTIYNKKVLLRDHMRRTAHCVYCQCCVLSGVLPVLVLVGGGGVGIPSILAPDWATPFPLGRGPGTRGGVPLPGTPFPPEEYLRPEVGVPPRLPPERTWDQRLKKGPGTRVWGAPSSPPATPPPFFVDRQKDRHL